MPSDKAQGKKPVGLQVGAGEKLPARKNEQQNKWWCTCKDPTIKLMRGRTWHDPRCVRNRWSHDSALAFAPDVGEQVRMMQSAGASAGKWFKFKGPSSKDWMPVELDDSD